MWVGRTTIHTQEYRTLVRLLRDLRLSAGLTQVELSERLGRPQSFVSKVERAERRLDLVELRQFCQEVGADLTRVVRQWEQALK
ncbi:MAG TPA: helix-turn-helix transcriptional regulator [Acidimicrobiales bacterium]|nr:helix-turn-helix transcriptional regulator [Acidimicrobiales bacterium]